MMNQEEFETKFAENPKELFKIIHAGYTELSNAAALSLEAATEANDLVAEYKKQVETLTQSNIDLSSAIKDIHLILNSHADLLDQEKELKEFRKGLAQYVISSGMIKLGVVGNAK